jgi:hypothetical protein
VSLTPPIDTQRLLTVATRNLMAPDDFKNLGFAEEKPKMPAKEPEKGVKGELMW